MQKADYVHLMKTADEFVERNHISDVFLGRRCWGGV